MFKHILKRLKVDWYPNVQFGQQFEFQKYFKIIDINCRIAVQSKM